ncbi:MAG: MFS transporter [Chloroflexi bacterium]|nr:MFS transporter [Chloroflexota bacterium]
MRYKTPQLALILSCIVFLTFGLFNAGIGPVLNELAAQTGSTLAAVGAIFTFLFLGSLIAQIAAGPLTDRFGQTLILAISLLLLGAGIFGFLSARSTTVLFAFVFVAGLGQGGVDLGANLVVSDSYPKNKTSMLNLLHFFFGLGAFIGPALVGLTIASLGSGLIVHWSAAGIFILLAIFTLVFLKSARTKTANGNLEPKKKLGRELVYLSPLLWILGGLILLYVGIEYALGQWISIYLKTSTHMALQNGALVTSAYWGALTLGRLASVALSRKMSNIRLLTLAISGSMLGGIAIFLSKGMVTPSIISLVWIGFTFGTVYPTTVAIASSSFSQQQGKAVGALAAMGSVGGLALPWLAGLLLEIKGSAFYLSFMIVILLLLLTAVLVTRSMLKVVQSKKSIKANS